jgi:hypothetical protein
MTIRQEIEMDVVGINFPLREAVQEMPLLELLRNCHPQNRGEFAHRLYRAGELTKEQAREFTKIVGQ